MHSIIVINSLKSAKILQFRAGAFIYFIKSKHNVRISVIYKNRLKFELLNE